MIFTKGKSPAHLLGHSEDGGNGKYPDPSSTSRKDGSYQSALQTVECLNKLTGEMSRLLAIDPRQQKDLPRNSTQTRYKDDPKPSLTDDMGHESIV